MGRKSFYIGCTRVHFYEVGTDPRFFEKLKGFAWKYFLCDLPRAFVEKILKLEMNPGDILRIKLGSLKTEQLTQEEQEEIEKWKSRFSTRQTLRSLTPPSG